MKRADVLFHALCALTLCAFMATLYVVFFMTPVERVMGFVQKIFYFHVPAAYSMYLGATACFVGSLGYLLRPSDRWNAIGKAGAELAVVFGAIVMTTGPLWAASAWGRAWTWDPRLTTTLLSVLVYVAYVILRSFGTDSEGERKFAAALGVLAAANLPIIHYSVKKWGGQHPRVIYSGGLSNPSMQLALGLSFLAFTMLAICMLWARARQEMLRSRLDRAEDDAYDMGLIEEGA